MGELLTVSDPVVSPSRRRSRLWLRALGLPGVLALLFSLLGLSLRIEHASTFDGPKRGADYGAHLSGVHWIMKHQRPFNLRPDVNYQVRFYPPLWYALGAILLKLTASERSIAALAVASWALRQLLLALILRRMIPERRWSICGALAINAVLPISVLVDGKVNPEGLHAGMFMLGVYALWRMEREASRPQGISKSTAVLFGVFAGLALLTKATAAVLPIACVAVILWRADRVARTDGWRSAWRRIVLPAVIAGATWCVVVSGWCVPNLIKHGHPFPHSYERGTPQPPEPVAYRRPIGWLLPFDWKEWIAHPALVDGSQPRPNFWAQTVTGTWSDLLNRGFCRLKGDPVTKRVWGGEDKVWGGPSVYVPMRCMRLFTKLVVIGLWITLIAMLSTLYTARRNLRSNGAEGSLVLPIVVVLGAFFVMLFTITYPYDGEAVLNPRYLLPITTPMSACLGFGLAHLERTRRPWAWVVLGVTLLAIAAVAILVVYERWGR